MIKSSFKMGLKSKIHTDKTKNQQHLMKAQNTKTKATKTKNHKRKKSMKELKNKKNMQGVLENKTNYYQ